MQTTAKDFVESNSALCVGQAAAEYARAEWKETYGAQSEYLGAHIKCHDSAVNGDRSVSCGTAL